MAKRRSDVERLHERQSEKTNEAMERVREDREDGERAGLGWREQGEPPTLEETKEGLRRIRRAMESAIERAHEEHMEGVREGVEAERTEVSEPAREDARTEQDATRRLEASAPEGGAFGEHLSEAAQERREAEAFQEGMAEKSENHQAEVKVEGQRSVEHVAEILREIEGFEL